MGEVVGGASSSASLVPMVKTADFRERDHARNVPQLHRPDLAGRHAIAR